MFLAILCATSCASSTPPPPPASVPSGSAAFDEVSRSYLEDVYHRQPTWATYLGIHKYNERLDDYSRKAVDDAVASARQFRERVAAIDAASLTAERQLDREQLLRAIDARLLSLEVLRPWAVDPDCYSSGLTRTAYIMIKRKFAPPDDRLRQLIAREKAMPAALADARKNLENPPRISTEIAIEQMDGNRGFFETAVAVGIPDRHRQGAAGRVQAGQRRRDRRDGRLQEVAAGRSAEALERQLRNRRRGVPEEARRRRDDRAAARRAAADRRARFAEESGGIHRERARHRSEADGGRCAQTLEADHPPADKLLATTQAELDALGRFMTEKRIVTIPKAAPARVEETPPFLRATTSASMDIPGPFETVATEAYYNMTLPDPKLSAADKNEFMSQWYYPAISNVSVHEVWPGHYLQFLYARNFPSDIRKVLGAATNSEGWAHYCEQMVIDEGFHADDPRYRLAQVQDALLRDVRFIVGIRMHTRGMTVAEAEEFFVKEGYQSRPVARSESKRGTSDATYGYYTMGKLMILKLREDYRAKMGAKFSLQEFPRRIHQTGAAAAAARAQGDARRRGRIVLGLAPLCRPCHRLTISAQRRRGAEKHGGYQIQHEGTKIVLRSRNQSPHVKTRRNA